MRLIWSLIALTNLSFTDRANCVAFALTQYMVFLDNPNPSIGTYPEKFYPISRAIVTDMRVPIRFAMRDRFEDEWTILKLGMSRHGQTFIGTGFIDPLSLEDDGTWHDVPALGRYLRDCLSTRLKAGLDDQILVKCIFSDNQLRDGRPATFFALANMPWEDRFKDNNAYLNKAILFSSSLARMRARDSDFEEQWESGFLLDEALSEETQEKVMRSGVR